MYGLLRILFAAAITCLTASGALFGGISIPLSSSFAFAVGVQTSTSAGDMPPVVQRAEALPGAIRAIAKRVAISAYPTFSLKLWGKPILLRRPTGLAVGLARKEPAPPPAWRISPENVVPPFPRRSLRQGLGVSVTDRRQCRPSRGAALTKRKYFLELPAPIEV